MKIHMTGKNIARLLALVSSTGLPASLIAASPSPTPAPEVPGKNVAAPAQPKHSFLDAIEEFKWDSVIKPTAPFELVPGKDPNDWQFVIEPYVWAMGIEGKTGVGSLPAMDVNVDAIKVLKHLDWAIFSKGEIRKGRWGILADGYYAALSGSGELGSVLYKNGTLQMQQGLASLSLAYRIIDDRRGFLDVYAGARYNYLGVQIDTTVDSNGVNSLTEGMTTRLANGIDSKVSNLLASNPGIAASDLAQLTKDVLTVKTLEKIADTPDPIREALKASELRNILNSSRGAFADYIAASAAVKIAAAQGQDTTALQATANSAKKKLDTQLSNDIQNALPTHGAGDQWWVDPIIGLRGQINITHWLFLAAQGDVGGFGAGSQITWNTQATVGFNITRNLFAELGYRYMYVDYNKNNFLYQMNQFGLFSSIGVKW